MELWQEPFLKSRAWVHLSSLWAWNPTMQDVYTIPPKFSQHLTNWLPGGHSLSVQTRPARCLTWILLGLTSHKPLPWRRTCDGFVVPKALGTKSSGFSWALEMPPSLTHILSGAPSNPPVCPDAHDASYALDQVRPPLMSFLTI